MADVCWCVVRGPLVRVCFGQRADAESYLDLMDHEARHGWQVLRVEYDGPYPPLLRDVAAAAQEEPAR